MTPQHHSGSSVPQLTEKKHPGPARYTLKVFPFGPMYHFGTIFLSFIQKMEMSSPIEETFFTKKIVNLSFLPFLFRET